MPNSCIVHGSANAVVGEDSCKIKGFVADRKISDV